MPAQNHSGGLGGGHYTAFCKNALTKKWYHFNDSSVTEVQPSAVVTSAAYMILYRRRIPGAVDTVIPYPPPVAVTPPSTTSTPTAATAAAAASAATPASASDDEIYNGGGGFSSSSSAVTPQDTATPDSAEQGTQMETEGDELAQPPQAHNPRCC